MTDWRRRKLLAALSGATTLAGCSGGSTTTDDTTTAATRSPTATDTPTPSPTSSPTETKTPKPVQSSELEYTGSVVRQPSEAASGKIRASLTNRSGRTLTISGGAPFPTSTTVDDGPTPLVLLPDEDDRRNEYRWNDSSETADVDDATYDGDCWRAPSWVLSTAAEDGETIPDDLTAAADLYLLAGPDSDCPVGTYTVQVPQMVRETEQFFRAELTAEVTSDRQLSVTGALSEVQS